MLYVSDRNGIGNIYERNLVTGADRPITNSLTGVFQLSLSADGNKLSFAALNEAGFDIYLMKAPFDKKLAVSELEPTEYLKRRMRLAQKTTTAPGVQGTKDSSSVAANVPAKDTAGVYGDRVHIDFQNYVFSDEQPKEKPPSPEAETVGKQIEPSDNVDEQGNYKVNKYKLNFSPDIIYGNAGYRYLLRSGGNDRNGVQRHARKPSNLFSHEPDAGFGEQRLCHRVQLFGDEN